MAKYIVLANYTDQGIRNIKESPKRMDSAKELAKTCGVEIKDVSLTIGSHDLVFVMEAPDDRTLTRFVLTLTARGNVRTNTLKAFPEPEYRALIKSLP
ncbi:MAG: GYD domain-containing protein [Pseudomonadota bacterium]